MTLTRNTFTTKGTATQHQHYVTFKYCSIIKGFLVEVGRPEIPGLRPTQKLLSTTLSEAETQELIQFLTKKRK